jgi:peptide/nickel transport system ATP-binding protein
VALLEVRDLSISFLQYAHGSRRQGLTVVEGLSLTVEAGEVVAVVGSSGSGKSLLAHAIMGILPANVRQSGTIMFDGAELDAERLRRCRGKELALVPQSVEYLDPLLRVGKQLQSAHDGPAELQERRSLLERLQLGRRIEKLFPFQLSGGMSRKVLLATAAVRQTRLIIADEPTPGMHEADVHEALGQFRQLADSGCAVLLITHDIAAALRIADRVAVLYAGEAVELAAADDFAGNGERLRHPYTQALWQALPQNGFVPLRGGQPGRHEAGDGCLFAARCERATERCLADRPQLQDLRGGLVRCVHAS